MSQQQRDAVTAGPRRALQHAGDGATRHQVQRDDRQHQRQNQHPHHPQKHHQQQQVLQYDSEASRDRSAPSPWLAWSGERSADAVPVDQPVPTYQDDVAAFTATVAAASARGARVPHHNFAWRDVRDVPYQLAPPGQVCRVSAPGTRRVVDELASCALLHTAAFRATRPLTHCAHYYFNRKCNLGAECRFVHAVFIDAAATTLRRAPAPVQLGRPQRFDDFVSESRAQHRPHAGPASQSRPARPERFRPPPEFLGLTPEEKLSSDASLAST